MTDKRTKIVATLGPASANPAMIKKLIRAGVDVFRLNFSHGDLAGHEANFKMVRNASEILGKPTAIMIDLCGPKIRTGNFKNGEITLEAGKTITLTTKEIIGDESIISINYAKLPKEVKPTNPILLDDGRLRFEVLSINNDQIVCKIIVGGTIKDRRGLSAPQSSLSLSSLTEKDKEGVACGAKLGVDFFALSFVRSEADVLELRALLSKVGSSAGIVAKVETRGAVEHIHKIIEVADGIMVARGDLAVEASVEEVPLIQKNAISHANDVGKPVITATQMLESMKESPVPTRAETSDVANAILDGTDALMLSTETALGLYPVEAVSVMDRIAGQVEKDYIHRKLTLRRRSTAEDRTITDSVTSAAVTKADKVGAKYIVAFTMSGKTARMLSRHKPRQKIIVMTPSAEVARKINLSFGTDPVVVKPPGHIDDVLTLVRDYFISNKMAKLGDKIILVCGLPFGQAIDTNMVLVQEL